MAAGGRVAGTQGYPRRRRKEHLRGSRARSGCWRSSWRCWTEHGLTLPPEAEPLRGFGRAGQINWRLDGPRRHAQGAGQAPAAETWILTLGLWRWWTSRR